jgi:hypothetical protein
MAVFETQCSIQFCGREVQGIDFASGGGNTMAFIEIVSFAY